MKIKKVLGEGSYGSVAVCEKNGGLYALKTVQGDSYGLVCLQEIDIMNSVSNPFLVNARKTYIEDNNTYLFMDLASETLHRYRIRDSREFRLVAFQMVAALAFLEKRGIVHGDIKGNNFLCYRNAFGIPLNVRLTDFSLSSRYYGRDTPPAFRMYCSIYRPLEAWFSEAVCKSDVWALGCCLYEMFTGESQLFPSQDETDDTECVDLVENLSPNHRKVHERWRHSFDVYLSALYEFACETRQPITPTTNTRLRRSLARNSRGGRGPVVRSRRWADVVDAVPAYIRAMLVVDPAFRPSALELFYRDDFAEERNMLTGCLLSYYNISGIPHSDNELVILDGTVKHHMARTPLEYEDVDYFFARAKRYSRMTVICAMDIYSKCKHMEMDDLMKLASLMIGIKLTDPQKIVYFEWDQYEALGGEVIEGTVTECEKRICQYLNYVLYPENERIFDLTDDQLTAFYV